MLRRRGLSCRSWPCPLSAFADRSGAAPRPPGARAGERGRRAIARLRARADRARPAAHRIGVVSARGRLGGASSFALSDVTRVTLEPFTIERGWERVSARARIVAPSERAAARRLARLDAVDAGRRHRRGRRRARPSFCARRDRRATRVLQGRIVLLPDGDPPGDGRRGGANAHATSPSRCAPPACWRCSSPTPIAGNQLSARGFGFSTAIGVLPAAQIGRDDAQLIRDLLARGPVRLSLELINRVTPAAVAVENVVAEPGGARTLRRVGASSARISTRGISAPARRTTPPASRWCSRPRAPSPRCHARRGGRSASRCGAARSRGSSVRTPTSVRMRRELDRVVADLNTRRRHRPRHRLDRARPRRRDPRRAAADAGRCSTNCGAGSVRRQPALRLSVRRRGVYPRRHSDARPERRRHELRRDSPQGGRHDGCGSTPATLAIGAAAVAATAYAIADAPRPIAARRRPSTKGMD